MHKILHIIKWITCYIYIYSMITTFLHPLISMLLWTITEGGEGNVKVIVILTKRSRKRRNKKVQKKGTMLKELLHLKLPEKKKQQWEFLHFFKSRPERSSKMDATLTVKKKKKALMTHETFSKNILNVIK